nr:immunoglobulin light chain junction region [Macaca mulatta]MOW66450.1 immunoglobulin light chain junction region [Macaca mulatta]MOW66472.1 immunoglobulin light chain junction region [Macaca mulatta]MOW67205.1 immunoglobulin light chain junction region [Macaca mulatta]MOW67744.1 immunoglobulin light chain junction region [Macaca mulatta]
DYYCQSADSSANHYIF